jgi:hypothetical protein
VQLSRQEAEGSYTFQAAESGVEEALSRNFKSQGTETLHAGDQYTLSTGNRVNLNTQITAVDENFMTERPVKQGESVQIDLGTVPTTGLDITVGFGKVDCTTEGNPGLLIVVYNQYNENYSAKHYMVACTQSSLSETNIPYNTGSYYGGKVSILTSGSKKGVNFGKQVKISLDQYDKRISIHPILSDTTIALMTRTVHPMWSFPKQQFVITSTADNQGGNETKKVEVVRSIDYYPPFLDFAIYSNGTVVQQVNQ